MPSNLDPNLLKSFVSKEYNIYILKYSIVIILIAIGAVFICQGIESDATIKLDFNGFKAEFNKAMPGLVIIFLGVIVFLFSNPSIKINK